MKQSSSSNERPANGSSNIDKDTDGSSIFLIKSRGASLNVTRSGPHHAETIILLHGGPGVPYKMDEVAVWLRKKYQVIYFEQRGTGKSICSDRSYTMDDYVFDMNRIADYFDLESFHLFGHSWGGLYAEIYAENWPEKIKSLFLCSPSSGTNTMWKETEKEVFQFNKKISSNLDWLKMGWYSLLGSLGDDRAYRKVFIQVYQNYHHGFIEHETKMEELENIFAEPINRTRKEIIAYKVLDKQVAPNYPITITYGDMDIYQSSLEKHKERFPTATFFEIKDSGHLPWLHNPLEFKTSISQHYSLK